MPPELSASALTFSPFILLTERLIIIPTPLALDLPSYRQLYASLHANPVFCNMGFGPQYPVVQWTDGETREVIHTRDVIRCWEKRGMGDFALAMRPSAEASLELSLGPHATKRLLDRNLILVEADHDQSLAGILARTTEWVGYAGVRDATTSSMPPPVDHSPIPPWQEMVEIRYGVTPAYWGRGFAQEAARAVMSWAAIERGARRFIAETEKTNVRSGRVLEKLGFRASGTDYWQEPSEIEWERCL